VAPGSGQRNASEDRGILAARHAVYLEARAQDSARWSRHTRNWTLIGAVRLNPEKDSVVGIVRSRRVNVRWLRKRRRIGVRAAHGCRERRLLNLRLGLIADGASTRTSATNASLG